VTPEGAIVVDDKFEQNYDEILTRIRSVTEQPVKYVLNTHHHGDHTGGNARFMSMTEAQVIGHRNVRENILRNNQMGPPAIVFSDETAIHLGGVEVQAHHFGRGHTNGDSVIYFPDLRVVHTGDLFVGTTPFGDYANGGSLVQWTETLDNILTLDFDTVIPGHGDIMTKDDMREFRQKIQTMVDRGRQLISQDVSEAEFRARLNTQDLGWDYSQGFAASTIPGLYNELSPRGE
jgi:glyoxylase-like metal-dependent hydrolase (beta-lactamase superfamily II)